MSTEEMGLHFLTTIAQTAAATLSKITGRNWGFELGRGLAIGDTTSVVFGVSGNLEGSVSFDVQKEAALTLVSLFTGEPASDPGGDLSATDLEALDELMRTVAGAAATALTVHFSKVEFQLAGHAVEWAPERRSLVSLNSEGDRIQFIVSLSKELVGSLANVQAPDSISGRPVGSSNVNGNLEMLLEMELPVTLRFGRREMLIKDILELSAGSVIELDRQIAEPVDLLVDRRVIARGEVVIMDGNYGLRVLEVATPEQKIQCLGQ